MRLPVPDPRALLGLPEQLLGRVTALLDSADGAVARVERLLQRIEATRLATDAVVRRVDAVVAEVEPLQRRMTALLDGLEPPLSTLQPVLRTLADTTSPAEVEALVTMSDHLPELATRVETDLLPVMSTMKTVAPDIHDLLDASRELNEMLGKLPGMGRIRRRVEEAQESEDRADA